MYESTMDVHGHENETMWISARRMGVANAKALDRAHVGMEVSVGRRLRFR